jgi:hypothetical protein
VAIGVAELRNQYGTGHGDSRPRTGLGPRHAHLAVNAAFMWCQLLLDTLVDPDAPWRKIPGAATLLVHRSTNQLIVRPKVLDSTSRTSCLDPQRTDYGSPEPDNTYKCPSFLVHQLISTIGMSYAARLIPVVSQALTVNKRQQANRVTP